MMVVVVVVVTVVCIAADVRVGVRINAPAALPIFPDHACTSRFQLQCER